MTSMILPGTYIEVRAEGLITPGRVTVGNMGVIGTASKGPVETPVLLSSLADARQHFGEPDSWIDKQTREPRENALTLVRALELAFAHGATTVYAVRVANKSETDGAKKASYTLQSATGTSAILTAGSEGAWGNELSVNVTDADEDPYIEEEKHDVVQTNGTVEDVALDRKPVEPSARNRLSHFVSATGITHPLIILYDDEEFKTPADEPRRQVKINTQTGELSFREGEEPADGDTVMATYVVNKSQAVKVTIRNGRAEESYTVIDGDDLLSDINGNGASNGASGGSNLIIGEKGSKPEEAPSKSPSDSAFAVFKGGNNGAAASAADYDRALQALLNEDVHIIVAAGQDDSYGDNLDAHVQVASSDAIRRERIAVVGSRPGATVDQLRGHSLASDRVIFVGPGIRTTDSASGDEVTLPGSFAAAAVAGMLAGLPPHISLTNKTLRVGGLESYFNSAELTQLVQNRILALEKRQGLRVVKGITTATNTAWAQITTRRIVDFAKFGVRSAANPYIGLLNNDRVRGNLRSTINSFLTEMVEDEMLRAYELEVAATRDEEIKGIVRVTMVLQPTFSIDFIKVIMILG